MHDTSELCCTQCGRLEEVFGAVFDRQYLYSNYKRRPTKSYSFKYYLNRILDACKGWVQLSADQIAQAHEIFAFIESFLPKRISYPFVAFKILDIVLPLGKQRGIRIYLKNKIPRNTKLKHERTWNYMLVGQVVPVGLSERQGFHSHGYTRARISTIGDNYLPLFATRGHAHSSAHGKHTHLFPATGWGTCPGLPRLAWTLPGLARSSI